jgi:hypothetical protein
MTMMRFSAALALLFGLCSIQALPAHAGTVSVTYNYVYFGYVGKHQRQPRALGSYGGFTLIASQPGGQQSTGLTFQPGQLPMTEMVGNATYNFAFVTITGGSTVANGPPAGVTSTNANQPPSVVVENSPIVVLAVYVPTGGTGGGGGTGATIDSFDETTGSLFNDTFVKVAPDQNNVETSQANVFGFVDTTSSAETITALSPTQPTGVNFSRWLNLAGNPGINGPALSAAKGANSISLAFYDAPPMVGPPQKSQCQQELDSLNQVTQDRGPLLTVTMYNGIKAFLAKCVLQHQLTQAQVTAAENAYQAMLKTHNNPPPPPPHL